MMPDPDGPANTGPSGPAERGDDERAQHGTEPATEPATGQPADTPSVSADVPGPAGPVSDDDYDATVDDEIEHDVYDDEDDDSDDDVDAVDSPDGAPEPGTPDATGALLNALAEGFGLLEQVQSEIDGEDGPAIETDAEGRAILRAIAPDEDDADGETTEASATITAEEVVPIMEAMLFVSSTPLTPDRLRDLMGLDSIIPVRRAADRLRSEYDNRGRSFELVELSNGYILQTRAEFESYVTKLRRARQEQRMTHAALVTLSIIAYKQPITRSEIDSIRGAGSQHHIRNLIERGLVRVVGRKHAPGYPSLYGTTSAFLRQFGLRSLRDLPQEAEFGETDVEAIRAASREDLHDGDDDGEDQDVGLPTIGDDGGGEDGPAATDLPPPGAFVGSPDADEDSGDASRDEGSPDGNADDESRVDSERENS